MRLWIFIGILSLVGCAKPFDSSILWDKVTPEEQAVIDRQAADAIAKEEEMRAQKIIANHRTLCNQLGFKDGTPDFGNCVLRLYSNEEANKATRSTGGPTFTNCNKSGNSVNCTSF